MMTQLFWNTNQNRFRTFWRLLAQILLLIALAIPLTTISSLPALAIVISQGGDLESLATGTLDTSSLVNQVLQASSSLAILAAMLLSVWLTGKFADKRPFTEFGFHFNRNWWLDFVFGLALGAGLMALIFAIELATGMIEITDTFYSPAADSSFAIGIFSVFIVFISVGIYEELFSRGYQLRNAAEGFAFLNPKAAILISTFLTSIFFGLLHANNPNATAVSTFNIFIAGIFLALGFILTGELAIPIALHITWNFFQGNVFGFPVSGQGNAPSFIAINQLGNPIITGGQFGPEAGLIGLAAIFLGCLLIAGWVKWRYGRVQLFTQLTVPTRLAKKEDTIETS